ncbi:MAG: 3-keto-disaccharide hydrolase [Pirellulaceae bacterium]
MRLHSLSLALASLLCLSVAAIAADKNPAFTDAAKAGPDFAFQGEYAGGDGDHKWGAQVIALGEGKFDVVGFKGGLPGDGWKRGDETKPGKGELKDGAVTLTGEDWTGVVKDGAITVKDKEGTTVGELKKVERKSPTLGVKPPEGAKVLFDGTTPDNFDNGKIIEDNLLASSNPNSKAKFQDHTLHIEFRTPFMPLSRGQSRGNSGVYMQGRYELQVLDSFGLDGADNECGGIYSINKPIVNACLPPLAWQTYDIEFTAAKYDGEKKVKNARCTIKHNGIVIHDDQELSKGTPGKDPEGPQANGLFLQDHGNPVAFRNIWVVEKK